MTPQHSHSTPFKGLVPYTEEDAEFFFGREMICDTIIASLQTWSFTLLYGASGVGKSSVLNAGVMPRLRQMAWQSQVDNQRTTPEFSIITFNSWRDDPATGLARTIQEHLTEILNANDAPLRPETTLSAVLDQWMAATDGELYIILDQFEEYFQYHGREEGPGSLAIELPRAVSRRRQRIKFLISIREDAVAKLDLFKSRLPDLFEHILRVRPLGREEARKAIEGPIEKYNALQNAAPVSIEARLLDAVLQSAKRVDVVTESVGIETSAGNIDAAILQQVMTRLWEEDVERSRLNVLRFATFERLGGARTIVSTHFGSTMNKLSAADQNTAAAIFRYLVTPSGTKIAQTATDLAAYSELPEESVKSVLQELSGSDIRILRAISPPPNQKSEVRYEIFHDVLSGPITDWWREYEAEESEKRARREAIRDLEINRAKYSRRVAAVLSVMLIIVSGLMLYAFQQRAIADRSKKEAVELAARETTAKQNVEDARKETFEWAERAERQAKEAIKQAELATKAELEAIAAKDQADKRTEEMEDARKTDEKYREAFRQSRRKEEREHAIGNFQEAVKVYRKKSRDRQALIDTYINIGEIHADIGNDSAASESFAEAVKECKHNKAEKASVLTTIGDAYKEVDPWSRGDGMLLWRIAEEKYREALKLYDEEYQLKRAAVLISLATVSHELAGSRVVDDAKLEREKAYEFIEEAIDIYKANNNHQGHGFALFTLATLKFQAQEPNFYGVPSKLQRNTVIEMMEEAARAYHQADKPRREIMIRKNLVALFDKKTQREKVRENLSTIVSLYGPLKDNRGHAEALVAKATFILKGAKPGSAEYKEALADFRKAATLYSDENKAAETLRTAGNFLSEAKQVSQAEQYFEEAAVLFNHVKNFEEEIVTRYNQSRLYSETDSKRALGYLHGMETLFHHLEKSRGKASAHVYLGKGYLALKEYTKASESFDEVLKLYDKSPNISSEITDLGLISDEYLTLPVPRFEEAIKYLKRATALQKGNPYLEARTLMTLGGAHIKAGQPQDALQRYQEAAEVYKTQGVWLDHAKALWEVGKIYRSELRFDESIKDFTGIRQLFSMGIIKESDQIGEKTDEFGEGAVLMQLAELFEAKKEIPKAIESYEDAVKFYNQRKDGKEESKALTALSALYELNCEPEKAALYKQRAEKALQSAPVPGPPQP